MKIELDDKERKMLQALARGGAMSPSQISAETLILPGDTVQLLKGLVDAGLVLMRDDADSPDGKLVALSSEARDLPEISSRVKQFKR